jgi:probable F420-dependent oxidoreductase
MKNMLVAPSREEGQMKWGLLFSSTKCPEPDRAIALAIAAEQAGFDMLLAPEHVVVPTAYDSEYGFSDDGKLSACVEFPDPLIWLAYVAAVTSRIRLGTGILILPEHNPVILAKATATLDKLSSGRLVLGIGVGWLREEFDAIGEPFEQRGARTDEYIEILRTLWNRPGEGFEGRFRNFGPVTSTPSPFQPGGVPIHCGGDSKAAARRAGRVADGFFPAMYPTSRVREELPGLLETMREAATAAGRQPDSIEITAGGARTAEAARWYADQGVDRLTVTVRARTPEAMREELLRFGSDIIEPTAAL